MRGYRILDEISIQELLTMRNEQGMTNQEIAEALDIAKSSVYRLIGKGPRKAVIRRTSTPSMMHPEKEEIPACLKVEPTALKMTGAFGQYEISGDSDVVSAKIQCEESTVYFYIPLDQLSTFIRELQAIERNLDKAKPKLEVW